MKRPFVIAAVFAMAVGSARAQSVENHFRELGLLGTWAENCALRAGHRGGNVHTIYAVEADGAVTLTYDSGAGSSRTVSAILRAARRGEDRIAYLQENRATKARIEIELLIKGDTIRVWDSRRATGEVLVRDGKFPGGGESPTQARCR